MVNYGSTGPSSASSKQKNVSRSPILIGAACLLAALVVIATHPASRKSSLLSTDDNVRLSSGSDDLVQKAAELVKEQKEKVARAAIKLEKEEKKEEEVEMQAAKIQESAKRIRTQKVTAESKFETMKHNIILNAAQQLQKAEEEEVKEEQSAAAKSAEKTMVVASKKAAQGLSNSNTAEISDERTNEHSIAALQKELAKAKKAAAQAERRMMQNLAGEDGAPAPAPMFREGYKKGDLGVMAISKWVPEDHPPTHADCKLDDIDCDELWPWGKAPPDFHGPPKRDGPLGDNLVGIFGQDDVVVPTEDSGLFGKAQPYEDKFDHWPENSKRNKDLLYGLGRTVLSRKYTGAGDVYVPLETAKKLDAGDLPENADGLGPGAGLADMVFGSWHLGFNKPHHRDIDKTVNMFDQPYRQHASVVDGKGPQVYNLEKVQVGKTLGDDDEDEE